MLSFLVVRRDADCGRLLDYPLTSSWVTVPTASLFEGTKPLPVSAWDPNEIQFYECATVSEIHLLENVREKGPVVPMLWGSCDTFGGAPVAPEFRTLKMREHGRWRVLERMTSEFLAHGCPLLPPPSTTHPSPTDDLPRFPPMCWEGEPCWLRPSESIAITVPSTPPTPTPATRRTSGRKRTVLIPLGPPRRQRRRRAGGEEEQQTEVAQQGEAPRP
eukprot:GAFH01003190.1.p2 GENE.GAFH01003190.1~~GAFH01003190.1.p2  ORF type:complete len:217 (-),score=12.23 GAFH01003190.1:8-658(-)